MFDTNSIVRRSRFDGPSRCAIALVSLCVTLAMLGFVIHYSAYGFDFTDEGFYAFSLAYPQAYDVQIPVSFFGFVYHPLYQLFHGDIVALRQANVMLTFGAAWLFSLQVLRRLLPSDGGHFLSLAALSGGVASSALTYFALWWLVTPSYNSLAFQGMLLTFAGVMQADASRSWRSAMGWACVGIGGWLVFLAKPSTAALLAPSVLVCMFASGKRDWLMLAAAAGLAAALLLLSALFIDGSIGAFVHRFGRSVALLGVLGSGQDFSKIFRLDGLPLGPRDLLLLLALSLAITAGAASLLLAPYSRHVLAIGGFLLAMLAIVSLAWLNAPVLRFDATVLIAIPIAAIASALLFERDRFVPLRPHLPMVLLLLAAPHIYAFGSNGNYWTLGGTVAVFWILAGLLLLMPTLMHRVDVGALFPLVLLVQFLVALLLVQGIDAPYRQDVSLRDPHVAWNLRDQGNVMLSDEFRDYLAQARKTAQQSGFASGDGMIDLTGRSPGLLYDLGALSLGQPWLVGAYPGSDALAIATLGAETCEALATAWLLVEPDGPRHLSVDTVVQQWGARYTADYMLVGSFRTASQAGGFPEQHMQFLVKPTRSSILATQACEQARQALADLPH